MVDTYRWGILSTANIGRKAMIPALQESKMAEVVAVASRDEAQAQAFAKEMNIPRAYGSYEALLDDPDIDAVYIPLPNHLHKEWTIRAAEAGKHILCEKPLALDVEECYEMIAAAESNQVALMESFMYRYHPRILAAREMIRSGRIGALGTIESAFTFKLDNLKNIRYQADMGGGALMDVGCYCVNISRLMAGREPIAVQARGVMAPTGVDQQLVGVLDFGEGLFAHFDCALVLERRQRCILAGTDGFLYLPQVFIPGEGEAIIEESRGAAQQTHTIEDVNQYRLIAEDFMGSIVSGEPAYPIIDAVGNMRTIRALLDSAKRNGKPVDLV